jgi:hypothetical protein
LALALIAAAPSAWADDDPQADARVHFNAGVNLLQDPARPRYDEAYAEFKKAYSLVRSPKILGNLGLCAMKLERDGEAIDAYTRYLSEVPDLTPEEKAQVARDLDTLKATLATVSIESHPDGAAIRDTRIPVQGDDITNSYGTLAGRMELKLRRGHHVLKARLDDGREVAWEADIGGGESHVFELPELAPPEPPRRAPEAVAPAAPPTRPLGTPVYVAGGVTVALGIASLATGLVALDTRSTYDQKNSGDDPKAAEDLRGRGTTLNVVSDVLLIGTLIRAGVTTYLFLTRPSVSAGSASGMTRFSGTALRF